MLCLGRSNFFRFNNPKEAHRMKQTVPFVRAQYIPSAFVPVESATKFTNIFEEDLSYVAPPMDSVDFVEKVSKFEYLSHSQGPTITSQDTPKYFIKEGIRILHSAPPAVRVHKSFPSSSETNLKNPSPVSRFFNSLPGKSGFSTPPPYHYCSTPRTNMSPMTTRLYSKTPDPVSMSRTSPGNLWSGRCTPTSPQVPGCRSHHVSVENLKACEHELHVQHRKAVQERLRDEEQERQERHRLEEILHLCAEYEEQAQKEKLHKAKLTVDRKDGSSSSSGEFSAVSTESSIPGSTRSSNPSHDSKIEGYSSEDLLSNGAKKPPHMHTMQNPTKHGMVIGVKTNISPTYIPSNGYHTVPNRIKTNGSLPRDRGHSQLPPTAESQQHFRLMPSSDGPLENGANVYINLKALNSASSEDELCAILGNNAAKKNSPHEEKAPTSPCMGTAFLTYPHSPRTQIKTVANRLGADVYENKVVVNEHANRKGLSLTLAVENMPEQPVKADVSDRVKVPEVNYRLPEVAFGLKEIYKLQQEKQAAIKAVTSLKDKISELDCQKNEILSEIELELALIAGELKDEEQLQIFEGNRLAEIQNKKLALEQKHEMTHQELEIAKNKVLHQEKVVENLQYELTSQRQDISNSVNLSFKVDELKAQVDLMDIEKKAFEDMEFQQLESQAHEEEEKEELGQEMECLKETIAQRQVKLSELSNQKLVLSKQVESEKMKTENQAKIYTEQLRQKISYLKLILTKLKTATEVKPGGTPCSSPESSPRTSDSDLEMQRNGTWNMQPLAGLDGNLSPRHHLHAERSDNCNSFHSFESESSSLTSSDTGGEGSRRSEDRVKPVDGTRSLEPDKVLQRERALNSSYQEQTPLVNHLHQNGNYEVRRRDKTKSQRPLTRYLPVRNAEFDLRQHIESAGHQIELCPHVHLTSTSCHGYLHKLGGKWRTWKKRWFVFNRVQKALLYYSDKGESKLKGGAYFQAIEEVYVDHLHSVKSPSPQSTFCVKTFDRVYYLMAPTPETMRIWVDVIFTGAEGYLDFLAEAE